MPADEARKLVEELTCKFEEVMALNRQRARLVDILITEHASDLTDAEKSSNGQKMNSSGARRNCTTSVSK